MTSRIEIEGILTAMEADEKVAALFPFDAGGLAGNLYVELLDNWDAIPEKTRSVMACVGAALKRQSYREIQSDLDAKCLANRFSKAR